MEKSIYNYKVALKKGKGKLTEELKAVLVMKKFGWTYEEYLEQPVWIIDLALEIENIDDNNR